MRNIIVPKHLVVIVVALDHAAFVKRNLLAEGGRHPVDDRALHLVLGVGRIHDVLAHIDRRPDSLRADRAIGGDADLMHLCRVPQVAPIAGETQAGTFGQAAAGGPSRHLAHA